MSSARPPYRLFRVTVEHVELATPHMKRVTIDGSCLSDFRFGLPAQWLKVFVPIAGGQKAAGRAYTVRHFDPVSKKLDLDFLLHGDNGPASAWAANVKVGDSFEISATHPRSGFLVRPSTEHYLLLGDETALPAIGAILEALPAEARADVFVEVTNASEEQIFRTVASVNLTWLHREANGKNVSETLVRAAKSIGQPSDGTEIWIAAESSIVK